MSSEFKVAAAHAAPVYMDKAASIQKTIKIIHEAAEQDVKLLVFPEAFIPGYPAYVMAYAPLQYLNLISEYSQQSISVLDRHGNPSEDLKPVLAACKEIGISIVLGVTENSSQSEHTLFSSQIFISGDGGLLGVHRKLMPTYAEKNAWANGGGATLKCWDMPLADDISQTYKIGGLICSENAIYTAKDSLVMEGEQVHAASWPGMCAFKAMKGYGDRVRVMSKSHAFCAATFVVAASSIFTKAHVEWTEKRLGPQPAEILQEGSCWSGIVDPGVGVLAEEEGMGEKLVVAEINVAATKGPRKVISDPAGHYRPAVLKMSVNRDPIWEDDELVAMDGRTK